MVRSKILVDIYLAENLGDDMFLDHLSRCFPDVDFVPFHPGKDYTLFFNKYKNIHQFKYTLIDKISARIFKNKLTDYERLSNEFEGLLFLGGGIFREESYWKNLYEYRSQISLAFIARSKKVIFTGCNFGPFSSVKFLEAHRALFKDASQITFRDQKSYKLFKDLKNVSYAPDVLWSYNLPKTDKKEKTLGISVIDPRHKPQYVDTYDNYIKTHTVLCENYLNQGFNVKLFSFCEKEGDLDIAREIAKELPAIEILNYTADITSYLQKIGSCTHFVAARFHAVIIAFKYGIPVIPIIYGDKTENLLHDLDFMESLVHLDTVHNINNSEFLTISEAQIKLFSNNSRKHFDIKF